MRRNTKRLLKTFLCLVLIFAMAGSSIAAEMGISARTDESVVETSTEALVDAEFTEETDAPMTVADQKVMDVKADAHETSVTLSWSELEDMTGYQVYEVTDNTDPETNEADPYIYTLIDEVQEPLCIIDNLITGNTYIYTVVPYVENADGEKIISTEYSDFVTVKPVYTKPELPSNLKAVGGAGSIALTWTAAENATGYNIVEYYPDTDTQVGIASTRNLSWTHKELGREETHSYKIRAYRLAGDKVLYSAWTTVVTAKTNSDKPAVPANLKAAGGENSITLTWTAAENATGYNIVEYYPETGKQVGIASTRNLSWTHKDLGSKEAHSYKIRAYRLIGDKVLYSDWTTVAAAETASDDPAVPTNLKAAAGENSITLSWSAANKATGYNIAEYYPETGQLVGIGSTRNLSFTHKDLGLQETHYYMIRSYRLIGDKVLRSGWTAVASAKTQLKMPAVPSNLMATGGDGSIILNWSSAENATGYNIAEYNAKTDTWTGIASTRSLSWTHKGLKVNEEHNYKIRSYRQVGDQVLRSGWTTVVSAAAKDPQAPGDLKNLQTVSGADYVQLSWSAANKATGYAIYIYNDVTGKMTHVASTKKLTYKVTGIERDKEILFVVRPYNKLDTGTHYGNYSEPVPGIASTTIPVTPVRVSLLQGDGKLVLSWPASSNATGYNIYQYNAETELYTKIGSTQSLKYYVTGLTNGKNYSYAVRAYRSSNGKVTHSNYSNVVTGTPKAVKNGWVTSNGRQYYYNNGTYVTGAQTIGGKNYYFDKNSAAMQTGWVYHDGYKFYYNTSTGVRLNDVTGIIGTQDAYEIRVNKKKNTVTIYAKDGNNGYIIPVKAMICSTGDATPVGTFYTPNRWRWLRMLGDTWGQWVTQIQGDYLFHSVYYWSQNNNDLSVGAYNNLGTTCSHGCIRLTAGDAKWIYDNCAYRTKVVINNSNATPLGKPTAYKLKKDHKWDPTDPNMSYKCKQKGCH